MNANEKQPHRTATERIKEVQKVRDELGAALHDAGVTLPSLRLDLATYAYDTPRPLVELGRCDGHTARALAAGLRNGAKSV